MKQASTPRIHFMAPVEEVIEPDLFEAPFGFRYREKMTASVARTAPRSWSMFVVRILHVTDMGSGRGGIRDTCSFRWNQDHATLSQRNLLITPSVQQDFMDAIDTFRVGDDMPNEWGWRTEFTTMTGGDVDLLARDIESRIVKQ